MRKGVSQISFPRSVPLRRIMELASLAGFEGVELRMREEGEFSPRTSEADAAKIKREAELLGLEVCSVVGGLQWKYPLSSPDDSVRRTGVRAAKRAVKLASVLGADVVLIVPAVVTKEVPYDVAWRLSLDSVAEIARLAGEAGVRIAVENVWNRFIFTPLEMVRFIDEVNSIVGDEVVGAYLDVGNVIPFGYPEHWVSCLRERVLAVHFKDMKLMGVSAVPVMPPLGDVDWPTVVRELRRIGYGGYVTAEVGLPEVGLEAALEYLSSVMDRVLSLR